MIRIVIDTLTLYYDYMQKPICSRMYPWYIFRIVRSSRMHSPVWLPFLPESRTCIRKGIGLTISVLCKGITQRCNPSHLHPFFGIQQPSPMPFLLPPPSPPWESCLPSAIHRLSAPFPPLVRPSGCLACPPPRPNVDPC